MPTTPPPDGDPETPASPYGPKATTPGGSEPVPPVVPSEPVPPVEANGPAVLSPPTAPSPAQPPPPAQYGVAPPAPYGMVPAAPYQAVPPAPYGVPVPPPYPAGPPKPPTTLSMLSMIFGIASVPLACCWGFGFLLAVAGIVLGHLGRKKEAANGMAMAGLIISYVVAGLCLVFFVFVLAGMALSGIRG